MFDFPGPVEARNGLASYLNDRPEAVPEDIRSKLYGYTELPSRVEAAARSVELVYARKDELTACPILLQLAAATAVMAAGLGFWGLGESGRGARIGQALRRDAGVEAVAGFPHPDPEDDPEPQAEYRPVQPLAGGGAPPAPPAPPAPGE